MFQQPIAWQNGAVNAPALFLPDSRDPHMVAIGAVNEWRGRCLASFARVEAVVTDMLVALAATDPAVPLHQLHGQRIAAFETAITGDAAAAKVSEALARFRRHEALRAYLAHGDATVTIDRRGGWHAVFALTALNAKRAERSFLVVDADEGARIADDLARDRQRFVEHVRRWRAKRDDAGGRDLVLRIGVSSQS